MSYNLIHALLNILWLYQNRHNLRWINLFTYRSIHLYLYRIWFVSINHSINVLGTITWYDKIKGYDRRLIAWKIGGHANFYICILTSTHTSLLTVTYLIQIALATLLLFKLAIWGVLLILDYWSWIHVWKR